MIAANTFLQYGGAEFLRGQAVFVFSILEDIVFVNWRDNDHVFICSNLPHITTEIGSCMRKVKATETARYQVIPVTRPMLVQEYTSKMYYVDKG